jgi:hypothetical protein
MGNDLKNKILEHNGISIGFITKQKPTILDCSRFNLTNALENKYCSKCSYLLSPQAYNEIKQNEEKRIILTDKEGNPLYSVISSTSSHDIKLVTDVVDNRVIKRPPQSYKTKKTGIGKRTNLLHLCLDKAYFWDRPLV